jgi:universal stress protein A
MAVYNKVLVALDIAADMDTVMARARAVAPGAEIAVVHVLEAAYFYYGMEPGIGMLPDNFESEMLARAERELEAKADRYGIPRNLRFLERGHAATQILRLAEDRGTDLIVLGSHGRHGWRLLLGSTANAVLHGAKCDVLAVRVQKK